MAVYRRGGKWWYKFEFGGRRIQESAKTTNKHRAEQLEAKRKSDLVDGNAGIRRKTPPPKFEDAVRKFLEWSRSVHRPKTHALHETNCDTLARYFRAKWMDEITSESVEQFRLTRIKEKRQNAHDGSTVSPATVNRALATLRLIFNYLELRCPIKKGMFFKEEGLMRVITAKEELAYLREASQPLKDIATIILQTGMRPEEVFRMEVRHIDFDRRTIFNPFGKTKTAKRLIPMTQDIHELLKVRVARKESPWVFYSPAGAGREAHFERHIGSVRKAHDAAVARAGIDDAFRLYDLRHTYATRAAEAGVDVLTLAALLGHQTVQMTMRYVHPTDAHKVEAAKKLEMYNGQAIIKLAQETSRVATISATVN